MGEHPRASDETGRVRLFHVLLELVELHRAARFYEETSGGPPGHPGCPHDPPSHLAHFLTQLAARADSCVGAIEEGSSLAPTREECARRGRWARELLSHATPPAPDECMEDMPSPGD